MGKPLRFDQKEKQRNDRRKDVRDIHLNVLGVPKANVNVNKTSPKQNKEDYHLYKISIDTTKKVKERKPRIGSIDSPQRNSLQSNRPVGYTRIASPSDSSEDDAPSYPRSRNPKKPGTGSPTSSKGKRDDNEICFTIPGEKAKTIKIVGSPAGQRGESSEEPDLKPKTHRHRRQVGFADYDAVYGTSAEESLSENDDNFPYNKTSPNVYKVENANTPESFFTANQPASKIEGPEILNGTNQYYPKHNKSTEPSTFPDNRNSLSFPEKPSFNDMTNESIGSKGKYPFYPYSNVKSSSPKGKLLSPGEIKELTVPKDGREFFPNEHRPFEKLPSIPEVMSFTEPDNNPTKSPEQQLPTEQFTKRLPQVIKIPTKNSSTSPIKPEFQKPYISVKKPLSSYSSRPSSLNEEPTPLEISKNQDTLVPEKKIKTSDAAISPMASVLKEINPLEEERRSITQQLRPSIGSQSRSEQSSQKPLQQLATTQSPLWERDSSQSGNSNIDNKPLQKLKDPSPKQQQNPPISVINVKPSPKVNKEVMTEPPNDLSKREESSNAGQESNMSNITSPMEKITDSKASPSKDITKVSEDKPMKSKVAAFVTSIPKPLFRRSKTPTSNESKDEENTALASPAPLIKEPSETIQNTHLPNQIKEKAKPVNETVTKSEYKPGIKMQPFWSPSVSENQPISNLQQSPVQKYDELNNNTGAIIKPQNNSHGGMNESPSVEISNDHYDGHPSGENINEHPESSAPKSISPSENLVTDGIPKNTFKDDKMSFVSGKPGSYDNKRVEPDEINDTYNDTGLMRDPQFKEGPYIHGNNKNILAFPGHVEDKNPFAQDPYKENEELIRALQGPHKTKSRDAGSKTSRASERAANTGVRDPALLGYPDDVNENTPYKRGPFEENEALIQTLQGAIRTKNKDLAKMDPTKNDYGKAVDRDEGESLVNNKKLGHGASPKSEGQTTKSFERFNKNNNMVYVGEVPNKTYDVFYSAEKSDKARGGGGATSGSTGPKGILIFVNKKEDSSSPLNKNPYSQGYPDNSKRPQQGAWHRSSKDSGRSIPSTAASNAARGRTGDDKHTGRDRTAAESSPYGRSNTQASKGTTRSKTQSPKDAQRSKGQGYKSTASSSPNDRTNTQTSKGTTRSKTQSPKDAGRSKGRGSKNDLGKGTAGTSPYGKSNTQISTGTEGSRTRSPKDADRSRARGSKSTERSKATQGKKGRGREFDGYGRDSRDTGKSKQTVGIISSEDSWDRNYEAGDDKRVNVERSPSGTKITETYPCGCKRIITSDPRNEIKREEIISAFCKKGSECEVNHPELLKSRRFIPFEGQEKVDGKGASTRELFPELEIIADGVISRKPIKPRSPLATMKGAKLTGSLNINSNKVKGVCNFYLDPRLKKYLRNNMEKLQLFLEDD